MPLVDAGCRGEPRCWLGRKAKSPAPSAPPRDPHEGPGRQEPGGHRGGGSSPGRAGLLAALPLPVVGPVQGVTVPLVHRPRLPLCAVHALPLHAWEATGAQPGPGTQGAPCLSPTAPKATAIPTLLRTLPEQGLTASDMRKAGPPHTESSRHHPAPGKTVECGGSSTFLAGRPWAAHSTSWNLHVFISKWE